MSLGLLLHGRLEHLPALAVRVQGSAFERLWLSETRASAILQSALVIEATERVSVGTNVALAFPRSPAAMAADAWSLQELSGGRFQLGLGSQVRRIVRDHYSVEFDPAAARMAEYIQAIRTVWGMRAGRREPFEGQYFQVRHPGIQGYGDGSENHQSPILLGAVGPRMIEVAATHADGVIGHTFTSHAHLTESYLPRIHAALERAARVRGDFSIHQGVIACADEDPRAAYERARLQIAFYGTTPNYRGVFESSGDGDLATELHERFRQRPGDHAHLVVPVTDEHVERYSVAGTPDEVARRLNEMAALVDHLIVAVPWYGCSPDVQQRLISTLLRTVGRVGAKTVVD